MKKHIVCIFVILIVCYLLYNCIQKEDEDCGCGGEPEPQKIKQPFMSVANPDEQFFPEYTVDVPKMESSSPYFREIDTKEGFFPEYTVDVPKMESTSPFYKNKGLLPVQHQEDKVVVKEKFFNEYPSTEVSYPMKSDNVFYGSV